MRNIRAFESFAEDTNRDKRLFIVNMDFLNSVVYGVFLDYKEAARYKQEMIERLFDTEQMMPKYGFTARTKDRVAEDVYIEEFTSDDLESIVAHIYGNLKNGSIEPDIARGAFETVLGLGVEPSAVAELIDPREVDREKLAATFRGTPFWPFINRTNKSNRLFGI